jgi:IMP dehydrogenase
MIGSLFAATTEAPGAELEEGGRRMKAYRGMGSLEAMAAGSSDRYFQERSKKLVPEGVVARVPHKGDLADVVHQLVGGLRAAMGYTGNATIGEMKARSRFVRMTGAGLRESHVHHVAQTHESPNYPRG